MTSLERLLLALRESGVTASLEIAEHLENAIQALHRNSSSHICDDVLTLASVLQIYIATHREDEAIDNMLLNQEAREQAILNSGLPRHIAEAYSGSTTNQESPDDDLPF